MINLLIKYYLLLLIFTGFVYSYDPVLEDRNYSKSVQLQNEREIKINLEIALSKLVIGSGEPWNAYSYEIIRADDGDNPEKEIRYKIIDQTGYLKVHTKEKSTFKFNNLKSEKWIMNFTDRIPLSFDIEIGAGKGTLDFTNLRVKDLNISAGAGTVTVMFNKPNLEVIEYMNIESGVSKFKAYNLSNANFNFLKFSGGLGSYELDFSGQLHKEVDVDIELGLGTITILIPKYIGAKVLREENWLSSFDIDDEFEGDKKEYTTPNYYDVKGKINFNIKSGIGTVKIKRIR